ncbi:MAG: Tfp pilus assembly protein PilO [Bradymonadia bacterium]|jgi:Tfp pilus assembly protein PilO
MSEFLDQFDKVPLSQKVLLLILVCFGLFVGYYLLLADPISGEIESAQGNIATLAERRAELNAEVGAIDQVRADIDILCEQQAAYLEKLPASEDIPSLLSAVNQQGELSGLVIQEFLRETQIPSTDYTTVPVTMRLEGTYEEVSDFFFFISQQERIMNVSDISLGLGSSQPVWRVTERTRSALPGFMDEPVELTSPNLQVTCTLKTYFTDREAGGSDICGT